MKRSTPLLRISIGAILLGTFMLTVLKRASTETMTPSGPIYILSIKGIISPVTSDYLSDGLEKARAAGAQAVVLKLDTPGGLLDATRDMVENILNSPLPVIVYISPRGGRAASAGVFITLASDLAAMAPQTHLGAAHPVSLGGGMPGSKGDKNEDKEEKGSDGSSVMMEKAVSDVAAYARTLALAKGRNAEWAEKAVRESVSLTADEAIAQNVVDLLAEDDDPLWKSLDGRTLEKNGRIIILSTVMAEKVRDDMSAARKFLQVLVNPNVAYILLMLGFYALIYEFASPGIGFGAAAGAIFLLLAFYSLQVLPVNYAGLGLILLGFLFLFLEIKVASHGLLALGGLSCLVLGSILLFDSPLPYLRVSMQAVAGVTAASGMFVLIVVKKVLESRKLKPMTGIEGLIGEIGEMRDDGMVFVHGEYWSVEEPRGLSAGDRVRVRALQRGKLVVERAGPGDLN